METESNWNSQVEDLVDGGDIEAAISLLESIVSKFETLNPSSASSSSDLRLASALTDLANLYSSRGLSLKADQLCTRSFLIKQRAQRNSPLIGGSKIVEEKGSEENRDSGSNAAGGEASASSDDDWESIADRAPDEVFSSKNDERISKLVDRAPDEVIFSQNDERISKLVDRAPDEVIFSQNDERISKLSLNDTKFQTPKRRGRGVFLYRKSGLYSDQQPNLSDNADPDGEIDDERSEENTEEKTGKGNSKYGTSHVLVLADFSPSTKTTELEKLFENFKDHGFVIRWVNDTIALAVFRTPSIALEARNNIHCTFTVRVLKEDDVLLYSISTRDLEPPIPRPKTSARTAQRLIAQGMGMKLPETGLGSSEFRKQEEARRNRITTRQTLRDDAWGAD